MRILFLVVIVFALSTPATAQLDNSSVMVRVSAGFPSLVSSSRLERGFNFCGEAVPLDIPDVRERLEKELLLNLWNRAQMLLYLKRSGRFFPYIEEQLKARGMPDDLKYLPVIESALKPHAGSRRGAMGFWQFIRSTGRNYGLRVDSAVDERRNLFTSTRAALDYLEDLHSMFGSWSLAAAGYNMGEQGLKKRIRQQKVNDYHKLHLPRETQAYLFRALAVKMIMSNPPRYGFHMTSRDYYEPEQFDRVTVRLKFGVSVQAVAEAAGTYYKAIKDLNPQLIGKNVPKGVNTLLVPEGSGAGFEGRFVTIAAKFKPKSTTYVVRRGDNLTAIARKYKVSLNALLKRNNLSTKSKIHPGQRLAIPR